MKSPASGLFPAEPVECAKQTIHLILTQIHRAVLLKASWCIKRTKYIEHTAVNGKMANLHYNSGMSNNGERLKLISVL